MRLTRTGIASVTVQCADCEWSCETKNGLGLAALHHDRTGHEVTVSQTLLVIYGGNRPGPGCDGEQSEQIALLTPEGVA